MPWEGIIEKIHLSGGRRGGGVGHHIYISLRMGKNPQFNCFILESLFISSMRCLTGA